MAKTKHVLDRYLEEKIMATDLKAPEKQRSMTDQFCS
jgi:hypothetical protein